MTKSPGQIDYERDVEKHPVYHDGQPRKPWDALDPISQWSWERGAEQPPPPWVRS
jgi:hypothetical protein